MRGATEVEVDLLLDLEGKRAFDSHECTVRI